jgi:hypothetical protein
VFGHALDHHQVDNICLEWSPEFGHRPSMVADLVGLGYRLWLLGVEGRWPVRQAIALDQLPASQHDLWLELAR